MFEYGSRAGFWRIHRLFAERGLPMTVFGCAVALELNPASRESDRSGRVRRLLPRLAVDRALQAERGRGARAHPQSRRQSSRRTVGARPDGWYCRYGPSINTRRLVVEAGGFLYDSDSYSDDLPYYVDVDGTRQLVVPYSQANNDTKFTNGLFATSEDYFDYHRDAFDMLYTEGAASPKMMSIGLHCRLMGHPARAVGLARLLDYIGGHPDVWVARRVDIARHWLNVHPPA